jgi:uncharacterized membrane protein
MKMKKMIGGVLILAGLAVLIYGIVQYTQFSGSVAGKLSGVIGDITGSRSDEEMKHIIMMIAGGVAALAGIVITVKK